MNLKYSIRTIKSSSIHKRIYDIFAKCISSSQESLSKIKKSSFSGSSDLNQSKLKEDKIAFIMQDGLKDDEQEKVEINLSISDISSVESDQIDSNKKEMLYKNKKRNYSTSISSNKNDEEISFSQIMTNSEIVADTTKEFYKQQETISCIEDKKCDINLSLNNMYNSLGFRYSTVTLTPLLIKELVNYISTRKGFGMSSIIDYNESQNLNNIKTDDFEEYEGRYSNILKTINGSDGETINMTSYNGSSISRIRLALVIYYLTKTQDFTSETNTAAERLAIGFEFLLNSCATHGDVILAKHILSPHSTSLVSLSDLLYFSINSQRSNIENSIDTMIKNNNILPQELRYVYNMLKLSELSKKNYDTYYDSFSGLYQMNMVYKKAKNNNNKSILLMIKEFVKLIKSSVYRELLEMLFSHRDILTRFTGASNQYVGIKADMEIPTLFTSIIACILEYKNISETKGKEFNLGPEEEFSPMPFELFNEEIDKNLGVCYDSVMEREKAELTDLDKNCTSIRLPTLFFNHTYISSLAYCYDEDNAISTNKGFNQTFYSQRTLSIISLIGSCLDDYFKVGIDEESKNPEELNLEILRNLGVYDINSSNLNSFINQSKKEDKSKKIYAEDKYLYFETSITVLLRIALFSILCRPCEASTTIFELLNIISLNKVYIKSVIEKINCYAEDNQKISAKINIYKEEETYHETHINKTLTIFFKFMPSVVIDNLDTILHEFPKLLHVIYYHGDVEEATKRILIKSNTPIESGNKQLENLVVKNISLHMMTILLRLITISSNSNKPITPLPSLPLYVISISKYNDISHLIQFFKTVLNYVMEIHKRKKVVLFSQGIIILLPYSMPYYLTEQMEELRGLLEIMSKITSVDFYHLLEQSYIKRKKSITIKKSISHQNQSLLANKDINEGHNIVEKAIMDEASKLMVDSDIILLTIPINLETMTNLNYGNIDVKDSCYDLQQILTSIVRRISAIFDFYNTYIAYINPIEQQKRSANIGISNVVNLPSRASQYIISDKNWDNDNTLVAIKSACEKQIICIAIILKIIYEHLGYITFITLGSIDESQIGVYSCSYETCYQFSYTKEKQYLRKDMEKISKNKKRSGIKLEDFDETGCDSIIHPLAGLNVVVTGRKRPASEFTIPLIKTITSSIKFDILRPFDLDFAAVNFTDLLQDESIYSRLIERSVYIPEFAILTSYIFSSAYRERENTMFIVRSASCYDNYQKLAESIEVKQKQCLAQVYMQNDQKREKQFSKLVSIVMDEILYSVRSCSASLLVLPNAERLIDDSYELHSKANNDLRLEFWKRSSSDSILHHAELRFSPITAVRHALLGKTPLKNLYICEKYSDVIKSSEQKQKCVTTYSMAGVYIGSHVLFKSYHQQKAKDKEDFDSGLQGSDIVINKFEEAVDILY